MISTVVMPDVLAFEAAADLVECALNTFVSTPACDIKVRSQRAIEHHRKQQAYEAV